MKKIILLSPLLLSTMALAQFNISIEAPDSFSKKEVMVYTLNGSKDFLTAQTQKKNGKWNIQIPQAYHGMLRAYFPDNKQSVNFMSENQEVKIKLDTDGRNITKIDYQDPANQTMYQLLQNNQKKERILPVLSQIKGFYNDNSAFDQALAAEINRLNQAKMAGQNLSQYPFIQYYFEHTPYANQNTEKPLTADDYIQFLSSSNEFLETSSLLKPTLLNFLRSLSKEQIDPKVGQLLEAVSVESPRGQTILAELLDIFETYGLEEEKDKYFKLASNLKCEINKNLKSSLTSIKNTMVGSTFPDYTFTSNLKNTKAKKLSDVKASKKLVLFWASTCPHCMSELPQILEKYPQLKQQGIEVVAFSLDQDAQAYQNTVASLPWINDSELKGWESSYAETYNVHATPTYYLLDAQDKIIDKPHNFKAFLGTINLK